MDLDIEQLALLKCKGGGGGGGGGGSGAVVRTYTGTLETIFSANNILITDLAASFLASGATVYMDFAYSSYTDIRIYVQYARSKRVLFVGNYETNVYFELMYLSSGTAMFHACINGEVSEIDKTTACTLTIIDHPLSSSITAEALSVTANSEYDAPLGKLYNHVSVEVPQQGATVSTLGPFDVGDEAKAATMQVLRDMVTNNKNQAVLIKNDDVYYKAFTSVDSAGMYLDLTAYYIDRTNHEMIEKKIIVENQVFTRNDFGSPFYVIRITNINA